MSAISFCQYQNLKALSKSTCNNNLSYLSLGGFSLMIHFFTRPGSIKRQHPVYKYNSTEHFDRQIRQVLYAQSRIKNLQIHLDGFKFIPYDLLISRVRNFRELQSLTIYGLNINNKFQLIRLLENSQHLPSIRYFSVAIIPKIELDLEQLDQICQVLRITISKLKSLQFFALDGKSMISDEVRLLGFQFLFSLLNSLSLHKQLKEIRISPFVMLLKLFRDSIQDKFCLHYRNDLEKDQLDALVTEVLTIPNISKIAFLQANEHILKLIKEQLMGNKKTSFKYYDNFFTAQLYNDVSQIEWLVLKSKKNNVTSDELKEIQDFLGEFGKPQIVDIDLRNNYLISNADFIAMFDALIDRERVKVLKLDLKGCKRISDRLIKVLWEMVAEMKHLEELDVSLKDCDDFCLRVQDFEGLEIQKLEKLEELKINLERCSGICEENLVEFSNWINKSVAKSKKIWY